MNQEIISKLKTWIEPLSVNQVKTVSPRKLIKELNINLTEFLEVIKFLKKERVIRYRYKFICDNCKTECIAYEQELINNGHACSGCAKIYLLKDIKSEDQVVYEFVKPRLLSLDQQEEINFTDEAIKANVLNFKDIKNNSEGKVVREDKIKVFFGSSKESAETMNDIAAIVGSFDGFQTLTWDSPNTNLFITGDTTIESLIDATRKVDAAIFIFNSDDKIWYRDEEKQGAVRDNVLFECGLFMGALGKRNVAIISKNKPKIASDLSGIKYIDGSKDYAVIRQDLKNWIQRLKENL